MKRLLLGSAIIATVALALKRASRRREEWRGLSETEVREKLEHRLPKRLPDERRSAVADKIVTKMRERGAIAADIDLEDEDRADTDDESTGADVDIDLTDQPAELDDDVTTPTS